MDKQSILIYKEYEASQVVLVEKNLPANSGYIRDEGLIHGLGRSPGGEDPLEENMASDSSVLAWRIPWTEEPGGLHTVHRFAKTWTRLKPTLHMHTHIRNIIQPYKGTKH